MLSVGEGATITANITDKGRILCHTSHKIKAQRHWDGSSIFQDINNSDNLTIKQYPLCQCVIPKYQLETEIQK